jgi:hypothetical protein
MISVSNVGCDPTAAFRYRPFIAVERPISLSPFRTGRFLNFDIDPKRFVARYCLSLNDFVAI